MNTAIKVCDLTKMGFTEQEVLDFLSTASDREQIRLLRKNRSRLLEDIHDRQQTLDQLDYFIYQIRQNSSGK